MEALIDVSDLTSADHPNKALHLRNQFVYTKKSSLTSFPEVKNIKVTFIEENNKEPISLPKIIDDYEKNQNNDMAKKGNRFKDIPVDISTKILRSNLREWGTKVNYGANLPRNRRQISKSIILESEKDLL